MALDKPSPDWLDELPGTIRHLVDEVFLACDMECRSLAAMGVRAIIDEVANDRVGDCGGFEQKLQELVNVHFISARQKAIIEAAADVGSAAAHRTYRPSTESVNQLMDIIEHVLQEMYVLRDVGKRLEDESIPAHPQRSQIQLRLSLKVSRFCEFLRFLCTRRATARLRASPLHGSLALPGTTGTRLGADALEAVATCGRHH